MSHCHNCDSVRPNRSRRFLYQPMAAEGGKTKGYANRTQEFILVIKILLQHHEQVFFIRSRHPQVSCVQQELSMISSFN